MKDRMEVLEDVMEMAFALVDRVAALKPSAKAMKIIQQARAESDAREMREQHVERQEVREGGEGEE